FYEDGSLHAYTAHFACVATKLGFIRKDDQMSDQIELPTGTPEEIHAAYKAMLEKQRKDHDEQRAAWQKREEAHNARAVEQDKALKDLCADQVLAMAATNAQHAAAIADRDAQIAAKHAALDDL